MLYTSGFWGQGLRGNERFRIGMAPATSGGYDPAPGREEVCKAMLKKLFRILVIGGTALAVTRCGPARLPPVSAQPSDGGTTSTGGGGGGPPGW